MWQQEGIESEINTDQKSDPRGNIPLTLLFKHALVKLHQGLQGLFTPFSPEKKWSWTAWLLIAVYFIVGGLGWSYILNWGDFPLDFHDWAAGTGHRLAYLKNAVLEGMLPLHMPDGSALRNVSDRFIATPDTIISPQVLLLRYLGLSQFVLANTLLLYTAGFVGLVLLARRLHWSPFAFGIVHFLFSFNGHIVDHVIVGHMHWAAYFLMPYAFYLAIDLPDQEPVAWRWVLKWSLVMAVIFLQGGVHLFAMSLMFLGLMIPAQPQHWKTIMLAGVFSVLVSLFRILPPALETGGFDLAFLAGFDTLAGLVESLIDVKMPVRTEVFATSRLRPLGWWEYDYYVGMVGALFLAWALLKQIRVMGTSRSDPHRWLLVPAFGMSILSLGQLYQPLNALGIPLLSSQRVATRFFVLPLLTLLFLGANQLTREQGRNKSSWWWTLGSLAVFAVLLNDLWQHTKLWRVRWMLELFDRLPVDYSAEFVANHPDPPYAAALAFGAGIALLSLLFLSWMALDHRGSTT